MGECAVAPAIMIDRARPYSPSSAAEFLMNWSRGASRVMVQSAKSLAKSATTYAWEPPGEAHSIVTTECRSAHKRRILGDRHRGRALPRSGNPEVGLTGAVQAKPRHFGIIAYALMSAPDLLGILHRMVRYVGILSDAAIVTVRKHGDA